jgi:hypothetical protein
MWMSSWLHHTLRISNISVTHLYCSQICGNVYFNLVFQNVLYRNANFYYIFIWPSLIASFNRKLLIFQILPEVGFSYTGLRCSQRSLVLSCYFWPEDIIRSTLWSHTGSQQESGGCTTPWPTTSVWKGKSTILKITWTEFGGGTSSDILNVVFLVTYRGGLVGRFPKSCVDGNQRRSFSDVDR